MSDSPPPDRSRGLHRAVADLFAGDDAATGDDTGADRSHPDPADGPLIDAGGGTVGAHVPTSVAPRETGSRFWARGLTKAFKRRTVVNDVDIEVEQGEIVGLLGPNGAGKTTTFYMMVGLISPDSGSVHLDGDDVTRTPMYKRARRGVGYLAQEPSIFRKLTVEENVLAILETQGLPRKEQKARLEELLNELSIAHLRDNKAYSLSGGERRRLEITRALVQRPKFILLDEPFAGIDPIAVNDIQQIVAELKTRGIGVIISDHNVEQTLEIVDRAYIMFEGRIRVAGTVSELVWNDDVADIYLGPILTDRMRKRFAPPQG
jgi:lipopolysaccharide export system ATP-binding protein